MSTRAVRVREGSRDEGVVGFVCMAQEQCDQSSCRERQDTHYTHIRMKLASETQHCKSDKMSLRKIEADMRVFWAWEYKVEFLQEDD
jgi:hypothetical protein